jgi:hypothetical protein
MLINYFFYTNFDLRGFSGAIMGFVILGAGHYLSSELINYNYSKVVRILNYPLLINNLLIILLFNFEGFKNLFYNVISVNPTMFDYPVPRYSGLSFDGFSFASTLNAIYFLILFFFIVAPNQKASKSTKYFTIINLLLTFLTTILIGRTGIGIIFIGIVLLLLVKFYYSSLLNKFKFLINSSLRLLFLLILIILIYNLLIDLPMFKYLTYGFKFYSETFESGEVNDSTINHISNKMFFFPDSVIQFFFGEGNFGRGSKYIESDLGFILGIHGYGIFGILLFLLCIFSFIHYMTYKALNKFSKISIHIIAILLILINFKDYYIFYPIGHYILFFTFVMYLKKYEFQR